MVEKTQSASTRVTATEQKWGKGVLKAGYTIVPNVLLEKIHALSLTPIDVCIILILAKHWWRVEAPPFPAKETIAIALGCSPRTVQRRVAYLEELGLVTRRKRPGVLGTNDYHLEPLVEKLKPFAVEARAEREEGVRKAKERIKRKRPRLLSKKETA